ncbi:hypothetical protein IG631_19374 [Alternaria alternata]|nr:hypothetical protein IG631_19374 [Alternaria alternata]
MGLREEDAKASDKRQQTASSHKCRRSTFFDEGAARIGSRTPHPCRFAASIDTAELAPHAHTRIRRINHLKSGKAACNKRLRLAAISLQQKAPVRLSSSGIIIPPQDIQSNTQRHNRITA